MRSASFRPSPAAVSSLPGRRTVIAPSRQGRPRDNYEDDDEIHDEERDEFNELNASTGSSTFLDQRWFRLAAIGLAVLVLASFVLPVVLPFLDWNGSPEEQTGRGVPDFVLPTTAGSTIKLSEFAAGHSAVVLVFHRGYSCQPCRDQLIELQTGYANLQAEGAELLAISWDSESNTQNLVEQIGIHYPMLYDETGTIAAAYGLRDHLADQFMTATVIVDRDLLPLTGAIGTTEGNVLPTQTILEAIRQANGSTGTAS